MIRVIPFIQTICDEDFKIFLMNEFDFNMLYNVEGDVKIDVLFDGWKGRDMSSWYKFRCIHNDIEIEVYPTHYTISNNKNKTKLSLPITINDFINDLSRLNVELFWVKEIDEIFEPKQYLHKERIKEYYIDLLKIMKKENELL